MTDFTETVKNNAVFTFSIVILSSLSITFLILLYTGIFGFGKDSNNSKQDHVTDAKIGIINVDNQAVSQTIDTQVKYIKVQLPMLYGSQNSVVVEGKKRGCDTVYMVDAWARADGDAVANHLKVLFDGIVPVDFYPGNYVRMYQRDLQFVGVSIENNVARVSLAGTMNPIQSACEKARLQIQIEEIVFQYPGAKSVEIVLNGNVLQN